MPSSHRKPRSSSPKVRVTGARHPAWRDAIADNKVPIALAIVGVLGFWGLLFAAGYVDKQRSLTRVEEVQRQNEAAQQSQSQETQETQQPEDTNDSDWERVYEEALALAESAKEFSETAASPDDWSLVVGRYKQSIQLLESIPESASVHGDAQADISALKSQLTLAQGGQAIPTDPFPEAINAAMEAANLTQTAQSESEWQSVAENWQTALNLLSAVPESSTNYDTAQVKITEYTNNLAYAQSQVSSAQQASQSASTRSLTQARAPRSGSCDCPYDRDSRGRRCGDRSAYSRPGGRSPVCYVPTEGG
jgi:hypothetical protein